MMPPLLVAGHRRQLPHTPAPAAEVIGVNADKKSRAGDFACPCVRLAHGGHVRVVSGDDQSRRWFPGASQVSEGRGA